MSIIIYKEIGVDTAENEPLEVWGEIQFNLHFTPSTALSTIKSNMEYGETAITACVIGDVYKLCVGLREMLSIRFRMFNSVSLHLTYKGGAH